MRSALIAFTILEETGETVLETQVSFIYSFSHPSCPRDWDHSPKQKGSSPSYEAGTRASLKILVSPSTHLGHQQNPLGGRIQEKGGH